MQFSIKSRQHSVPHSIYLDSFNSLTSNSFTFVFILDWINKAFTNHTKVTGITQRTWDMCLWHHSLLSSFNNCSLSLENLNICITKFSYVLLFKHQRSLTSIDNSNSLGYIRGHFFTDPLPQFIVYFLCLFWGGSFTGTNSPDWLIGNHYFVPLGCINVF